MIAVEVLHEYMRYIPQVCHASQDATSHIDGTELTLAQLDAFISTVIYCFFDGGVDKVGSNYQKVYSDTFSSF